jgi:hypothetical protein
MLVAQRDPVIPNLGDLGLQAGAAVIDGAAVQCREPEPAPLIKAQRIDVVDRGD